MKRFLLGFFAIPTLLVSAAVSAQPEYVTIEMEIDVAKPATEVWAMVGGYCDISEWLGIDCELTFGDGDMGHWRVVV